MAIPAGTHRLGPDDGTVSLRTGRTGAAAKAGGVNDDSSVFDFDFDLSDDDDSQPPL